MRERRVTERTREGGARSGSALVCGKQAGVRTCERAAERRRGSHIPRFVSLLDAHTDAGNDGAYVYVCDIPVRPAFDTLPAVTCLPSRDSTVCRASTDAHSKGSLDRPASDALPTTTSRMKFPTAVRQDTLHERVSAEERRRSEGSRCVPSFSLPPLLTHYRYK